MLFCGAPAGLFPNQSDQISLLNLILVFRFDSMLFLLSPLNIYAE